MPTHAPERPKQTDKRTGQSAPLIFTPFIDGRSGGATEW